MNHRPRPSAAPGRALAALALLTLFIVPLGCGGSQSVATIEPSAGVASLPLEVSVAEADRLRGDGALILDVREPTEWASGHIAGATLIPLGELASRVAELPRDQAIVVVCRSGNRSAQGRDILLGAGFARVSSMVGGMTDWTAAGLPVVTGS